MKRRSLHIEVLAVCFAALLLEISYTRIFSFKVSSYYTYLLIAFALLGMGAGGVLISILPRVRELPAGRILPAASILGSLAIGLGYFGILWVPLSTFDPPSSLPQILGLLVVCALLLAAFVSIGIFVAWIFARRAESISTLYFADLVGAGLGCGLAVPLMIALSPPGCVFVSAVLVALSGLRVALREERRLALAGAATAALLSLGVVFSHALPDPVVDPMKTMSAGKMYESRFTARYGRWHPVFRVDVLDSAKHPHVKPLIHDGQWGSSFWAWDGERASLDRYFDVSNRRLAFGVAPPRPRVLIIGSAGGQELLASLYFDAERITGVELNPVTVSLLRDEFADFTGQLAFQDTITLHNAEGRAFLERDESLHDLIYFVAPDSYAAMNASQASGFVLVEGYLYTVEMVQEAIRHLRPGGVLVMQFGELDYESKPNRTARYLSTARQALRELGIEDFERHVMVATNRDFFTLSTIVLSAEPFSERQIARFEQEAARIPDGTLRHVPERSFEGNRDVARQVITLAEGELPALYERYPYDIRPVTDDAPFFWHFARFGSLLLGTVPDWNPFDPEDGKGEGALLVMLVFAALFAGVFLLLPFFYVRDRFARLPGKGRALLYFACLGLGFMFIEIVLLQKWTLFLGYPTYTLSVTLFSLLVFSGFGSLATERYAARQDRVLPLLLAGLTLFLLFYQFGLAPLADLLFAQPLVLRIAIAALLLAPVGLCLGAFMPLGLRALAPHGEGGEFVAWGWAVNGFFSVIGSLLGTMLSMSFGFRVVLGVALALYLVAGVLLRGMAASRR